MSQSSSHLVLLRLDRLEVGKAECVNLLGVRVESRLHPDRKPIGGVAARRGRKPRLLAGPGLGLVGQVIAEASPGRIDRGLDRIPRHAGDRRRRPGPSRSRGCRPAPSPASARSARSPGARARRRRFDRRRRPRRGSRCTGRPRPGRRSHRARMRSTRSALSPGWYWAISAGQICGPAMWSRASWYCFWASASRWFSQTRIRRSRVMTCSGSSPSAGIFCASARVSRKAASSAARPAAPRSGQRSP